MNWIIGFDTKTNEAFKPFNNPLGPSSFNNCFIVALNPFFD